MAEFTYPPLTPDPDPSPLSPTIPLNPPMVGEVSPFDHVDGQNRDLILEAIRAWIRGPLRSWTTAWQTYLVYWLALVAGWLNTFVTEADEYITEHAIAGYSWRTTATPIAATGTTTVTLTVDTNLRPLVLGDLVSDPEPDTRYGIISELVDDTHAVVTPLGQLQGNTGYGWWVTVTPISASGTTDVVLPVETDRVPQVGDLVSDESSALRYGQITVIIDATHATVTPLGVLRGLAGFGWWTTTTTIVHSGTTDVVLSSGPDRLPQVNDLVVDESESSAYGEVTVVTDATHVTVAFVGTLQGPAGTDGAPGVVQTIVAGTNVTVDSTDPANPIVSAIGGGGGGIESIVAGTNITVDDTDPLNPIVSASGGGGGDNAFDTQTDLFASSPTTGDQYVVRNAPGLIWTALGDGEWAITGTLQIPDSDSLSIFDDDFWALPQTLWWLSAFSGITYKMDGSTGGYMLPWDSDWINVPADTVGGFELGNGSLVGMMKFTSGQICYRGILTIGSTTSFDSDLTFLLDTGLISNGSEDMPVAFTLLGDSFLTDGTQSWRGIVKNGLPGQAKYYLFVPDVAGSDNFNGDVWAGNVSSSVNHEWAAGSVFEWVIELPVDPTGTTYDDGRSRGGGDGGSYGDFPIYPLYPNQVADQTELDLNAQAHLSWNVAYGIPNSDPEAINPLGANFEGSDLIQLDWDSDTSLAGYVPVLGQQVQFEGLTGVSDLSEDTPYYINSIGGGSNDFTVSDTLGGSTVSVTSGSASVSKIIGLTGAAVVDKVSKYDPVVLYPIPDSGWYLRNATLASDVWLAYSF